MAYLSNYSANSQYVVKAFSALFGAGVTGDLIASGDTILTASTSKTALVNVLLNNSVVLNAFPLYGANVTNDAFAGALIDNMTKGSGVDAATIAGWKTAVAAAIPSYASRAEAVTALIDSVTNYSGSDANLALVKAVVNNRAEVGAFKAQNGASTFSTLSNLQTQVASVDTTAASVTAAQTATNEAATSYVLTTAQDLFTGTNADNVFRAVAGNAAGTQDQTTLNSSDIIDGAGGQDSLIVNLVGGNYNGGARVKNVETLQIGTNDLAAATTAGAGRAFDYNVNMGDNEVTGVNTVRYDQITSGERLAVNNITPSATGTVAPALEWANEAGSRAGTIDATYRQATISGKEDNQNVVLKNINAMNAGDGVLNIGAGMETVTINSAGTVANNTLNNSGNADTSANAVAADIISSGSLSKVVLTGSVAIGKAAGVVTDTTGARAAFIGETDRAVGTDMGLTADSTTNATESNLLSVGSRVTTVDASAMTGSANVRFVAKNDGSATDVTFKGGEAADYVEFEVGNINATGGKGNDTFAFINAQANGTFGEGDTIDGGEGADTIQIGLNGNAQTYNISETELRNKSSIGTIDLRGQTTNLTLSSDFVAKADTADSIAIRTDKIIQSSADSALNPTGGANNGLENASTHTVNLTKLTSNQSVSYTGGSGSDRIILSDATYNVLKTLVGGGNEGQTIAAGANRYDTITLVTNGENVVIDAQDLSKTSGFEGFVLTKNAAAATYNLTLTQAFLNNNTLAADDANTGIVETNFQIGTSAAANNAALAGGDTVNIDVRDILNVTDTGRAAGFTTRTFDVTSLENAGVTVNFIGNTGNLTLAQVRAAGVAVANGASANATDVTGLSQANPVGSTGRTLVFAAADGNTTTGWDINSNLTATANNDIIDVRTFAVTGTINGGAGVNTLSVRDGANISGAAQFANVTGLTFDATGVAGTNDLTMTAVQHAAFTGTVTATGTGANGENIIGSAAGAFGTALAGVENYSLVGGSTITVNAATTGVNLTASNAGASTVTIGGNTVTGTYALANAADVLVATDGANIAGVNAGAATTAEALTLTGGITMTAAQLAGFTGTYTAAGAADSITVTTSAAHGIVNAAIETFTLQGTGTDTITFGLANGALVAASQNVNIAAGGSDTITLNNASIDAAGTKVVNITGFDVANDKVIAQVAGAASIAAAVLESAAGAKQTGLLTGNALEINTSIGQVADFTSDAQFLSLLNAALTNGGTTADIGNGTYTVVAYSGANAGLYQVTIAGGDGTAGGDDVVELIGVLNGVGANALTAFNLA